jgi:omega-amidase
MTMQDLKITLIQSNLQWEDKEKNLANFSGKISFVEEEADLIILPEMFSTGFTMNAKLLAETMEGPSVEWLKNQAVKKKCVVTGSLIIEENGKYYNRLIWMKPDGFEYYDKRHLFSLAHEDQTYSPGKNKIVQTIKGWRILPLICYDLRFPVWSRRNKREDYDLLLYVANWPERRVHAWKQLLIARAIENQSYVAGLNRVGNDGHDIFHSGDSAVIDFKGEYIGDKISSGEFIRTYTLSYDMHLNFRKQFAFFDDRDEFEIKD